MRTDIIIAGAFTMKSVINIIEIASWKTEVILGIPECIIEINKLVTELTQLLQNFNTSTSLNNLMNSGDTLAIISYANDIENQLIKINQEIFPNIWELLDKLKTDPNNKEIQNLLINTGNWNTRTFKWTIRINKINSK